MARTPAGGALDRFLAATDPAEVVERWISMAAPTRRPASFAEFRLLAQRSIALLDERISTQVDAIIHHPRFQRLEASWRGLWYLVSQAGNYSDAETRQLRIRVLGTSWKEVVRDLEKAIEFDQSALFKKVYSEEYGAAGGEPYAVLLADYEVSHRLPADVEAVRILSGIGASAFCPVVLGAAPALLGLDSFRDLQVPMDLAGTFRQREYAKWQGLRESEDSRFLAFTMPRVLARLPYEDGPGSAQGFRYREDVSAPAARGYLWGTAVYALGAVLVRAFAFCGWLADIRGVQEGVLGGGVVPDLCAHSYPTDRPGVATKAATDVIITDNLERTLAELGFIALCRCKATPYHAFYSNPSHHKPRTYDRQAATDNARISAMLQYVFCAARFAHYLKVMGRDKVGAMTTPEECENEFQRWLMNYCTSNEGASMEQKARYPLREAKVQVREIPGRPGQFTSTIHLQPHFQLDQVDAQVKLVTNFTGVAGR